jgi:hypothetical protein
MRSRSAKRRGIGRDRAPEDPGNLTEYCSTEMLLYETPDCFVSVTIMIRDRSFLRMADVPFKHL